MMKRNILSILFVVCVYFLSCGNIAYAASSDKVSVDALVSRCSGSPYVNLVAVSGGVQMPEGFTTSGFDSNGCLPMSGWGTYYVKNVGNKVWLVWYADETIDFCDTVPEEYKEIFGCPIYSPCELYSDYLDEPYNAADCNFSFKQIYDCYDGEGNYLNTFYYVTKTSSGKTRGITMGDESAECHVETRPEYRRLWLFMVWTAVRRGEALGLEWERVSLGERPQALVCGKGDKERMIPLLPPAVEALGEPGHSGPVFNVGQSSYVTHRFHKVAQAAGVKAKLHDLRHTGLTWMVARGVPLKLVQDIAGHTSITTTMGYAKTFAGGAYDVLMKAFSF